MMNSQGITYEKIDGKGIIILNHYRILELQQVHVHFSNCMVPQKNTFVFHVT